jgi:hypothetical protein
MSALRAACAALLLFVGMALAPPDAAAACRVLDPELQGSYTGDCVNGLAQGQGIATGIARYRGGFVAGRKQGAGVKTWPNGDRYEGEFVVDLKHGHGVYAWGPRSPWAGERYSGRFVNDRRQGAGVYEWPDGRQLAGQWRDDLPLMALPPAMQLTARAHAERRAAAARPGARVCRSVPVGIAQTDVFGGIVQGADRDRIRIRIDRIGKFDNQLDGRTLVAGEVIEQRVDEWVVCR